MLHRIHRSNPHRQNSNGIHSHLKTTNLLSIPHRQTSPLKLRPSCRNTGLLHCNRPITHRKSHCLKDSRNIATYEKQRIAQALDLKLKTVGLLKTIIVSSANNYKMPLNDWMHQLANQTFSNIEETSISELQYMPEYSHFIESFYVFI